VEQAVANLAAFTHTASVAQVHTRNLLRIVRGPAPERGLIVDYRDGGRVLLDDNTGPTNAFLWVNGLRRGLYSDVQLGHIWQAAENVEAYSNLANICVLRAFLAKLPETHPRIVLMLRWRAAQLYG